VCTPAKRAKSRARDVRITYTYSLHRVNHDGRKSSRRRARLIEKKRDFRRAQVRITENWKSAVSHVVFPRRVVNGRQPVHENVPEIVQRV